MSDQHDPLCEFPDERLYGAFCQCALIGRVRADERERNGEGPWASEWYAHAVRADERERIAQALEAAAQRRWQRASLPEGLLTAASIARKGGRDA